MSSPIAVGRRPQRRQLRQCQQRRAFRVTGRDDLEQFAAWTKHQAIGVWCDERAQFAFKGRFQVWCLTIVQRQARALRLNNNAGQRRHTAHNALDEGGRQTFGDLQNIAANPMANFGAVYASADPFR
ncbi:hypothetical protein [Hyphomicrobium sp. D-2]|uniref:hypothetical protein n=1 Tax=Hyphomicrobium sp. D-2 TaxID=3041621 RepID=UPI002458DAD2|nr:hypothetical protein [Hyphomicrobium sp. D-2]MDH4983289.1 hypothetical protein [Hyphomicrobium sp. D-2]